MPKTTDRAKDAIESARQGLTEMHLRKRGYADQQVISKYLKDKSSLKAQLSKIAPQYKVIEGKLVCLDS